MSRKSVLKKSSDESSLEEKLLPLDMQRFAARCRPACSCYLAAVQLLFGFSSHVGVPVSLCLAGLLSAVSIGMASKRKSNEEF